MPSFTDFPSALPYFAELHNKDSLNTLVLGLKSDVLQEKPKEEQEPSHPFMEVFDHVANLSLTDNGAVTNALTKDPCLDLYYAVDRVSNPEELWSLYEKSWASDPEFTLHTLYYTRSIPRGKSLNTPFFTGFFWLLQHHPRTALDNLHVLVDGTVRTNSALKESLKEKKKKAEAEEEGWEFTDEEKEREELERRDFKTHGCWKDLCTLLTIAAQGEMEGPKNDVYKALKWPRMFRDISAKKDTQKARRVRYEARKAMTEEDAQKDRELAIQKCKEKNAVNKVAAKESRTKVCKERNDNVAGLLKNDKSYRALHFIIATLFADQLKKDMVQLKKNEADIKQGKLKGRHALGFNLSLVAKWAPSLCNSHDKHTFLATSIAENIFPPERNQAAEESREHYLNKVRDLYRKEYLIPLRKALDLTEHYMAKDKWAGVDYGHIPSICFQNNMARFFFHAPDSVMDFLDEVAQGTKKVSGETVTPNNLVHRVCNPVRVKNIEKFTSKVPDSIERLATAEKNLANGQWDTLLKGLRDTSQLNVKKDIESKKTDLGECIAICDVSGSMSWANVEEENKPYYAAIGLSLVITNLAKPPFNGAVITFSSEPTLHKIDTSLPFSDQVQGLTSMFAGMNTDLQAVFIDVLLPMAIKHKLKQEDMVKRLFIFTDMQFDEGDLNSNQFETTYEFIRRKYEEAGYKVPEIVWWNLSGENTCKADDINAPVTKDQEGTIMLSGFSSSMLKTFLDGDAENVVDKEEKKEKEKEKEDKDKEEGDKQRTTPIEFARKAVYHESFGSLTIVD
ncbi:hypothetical protein G6F56_000341 [Rhizopus delemar]|nr:hypothetical protein G6F56_000341 [Rhizopus delemar]